MSHGHLFPPMRGYKARLKSCYLLCHCLVCLRWKGRMRYFFKYLIKLGKSTSHVRYHKSKYKGAKHGKTLTKEDETLSLFFRSSYHGLTEDSWT
jgi:hypothetical protein